MSDRAPYSRVYWSVMDDSKFDGIREDVRLFGSWSLLLVVADMSYPAPAYVPRTIPKAAIARLSECGLIDLLAGHRYRIHGLESERTRRKVAATRDPSGSQLGPGRDPDGFQAETETVAKTRTSKDETDDRADLEAFLLVTRRAPTPRQRKLLDDLLERHDVNGPDWAADIILRHPDDPIGAVIKADDAWRKERIEEAKSREKPKPKPHRPRGLPESTREILEHWAADRKETA